ncbi:E3 ubiquitin-protein ligase TRIM69-like [Dermochelys coriacea]|uniref:E3 ubiquitin-protein ligase TRIM69-like n=1 Tax=Dermochelys coriacea TaxID=27794 RepID=UPI001CA8590E|nr:E3 ubiquitin-protein ligase TRIM69-like [Dermochelys coriacea]
MVTVFKYLRGGYKLCRDPSNAAAPCEPPTKAKSNLVQELQLAVTCPICTQYMEVPVTLDCRHNYCQACILWYWDRVEEEEEDLKQCPQGRRSFRQRSFRPNKLLAKVMVIAKRFPSQDKAQDVRSRSSTLGGVEPMGQQESFRLRLETLKRDLEIVLSLPCDGKMREHLLHFLPDGQQMILQKLQEMEGGNGTREEGEEREEEPDPEQEDENNTLSRSGGEKPLKPCSQSPEPCDCRLPLLNSAQRIQMKYYRVEVTLDLKTAYPELVVSRDRRSMHLGDKRHKVPDYYERFATDPCVLAYEGFSSGSFYWEVEVGGTGCWAVGVAKGSVKQKGPLRLTPEHRFWTMEMRMGKYWALNTSLVHVYCRRLRRVRICLDLREGQVAFYNANTSAHLYTFTASFMEEIFPFFYTKDKKTPLVINRSKLEGWIPLTELVHPLSFDLHMPSPAPSTD